MRKYIFLLSLFWAITTIISAQNITRLEYNIDGFVAEGKGTALEIPGNSAELDSDFNIDISELEPGNHTIYFRARNDEGVWSFAGERAFYIPENPITEGIIALEYTIDNWVKEGDGEKIILENGTNAVDSSIVLDIAGLQPGIHNVYMRAKNKLDVWSLPVQRSFVIPEPDTAKIENIFYRFYNDNFESVWMSIPVDPERKNVDSTIMASVTGLDFGSSYTVELYAENNRGVRGFSAFLNDVSLRMDNAPERIKDTLKITVSVNQNMEISMDTLFNDNDLIYGDSLRFEIIGQNIPELNNFTTWNYGSSLSLAPVPDDLGEYRFWLTTTDLSNLSDSIWVMLNVINPTGIADNDIADGLFRIYPNPARGYVNIKSIDNQLTRYRLMLFGAAGNLLLSRNIEKDEYRLPLKNLPRGLYFIVLENNEFKVQKKLIIH